MMNQEIIPLNVPYLAGDEWQQVKLCFDTNWVSSAGPYVDEFGRKFSDYLGVKYAVPVSSGTAAIHVALRVLGIGPGDLVLVPSLTFIASVNPVTYVGATPVFVDSEREIFNIDPDETLDKIKQLIKINKKPKAVMVVHLYGHSAYMRPILDFCRDKGIYVIEDATEALGTKYMGKFVGTLGDIGCFSFNGNKIITTGGGGMLVTGSERWAKKARYYSEQARDDSFDFIHNEVGYNYRMSNIAAAFGIAQLGHISEFIFKKKQIAAYYKEGLASVEGITLNPEKDWCDNNFWLYSILIDNELFGIPAHTVCKKINEQGIQARPFFKPIHTMLPYRDCDKTDLSDALWLWEHGISLPSSVGLDKTKVYKVIDAIKAAVLK